MPVPSITNQRGLSLAMAVWLAHEEYSSGQDQFPGQDMISATTLIRPTRQIVLASRVDPSDRPVDVADRISSRLGHAIHTSIEDAWRHGYEKALTRLGYPRGMVSKIRINPKEPEPGIIPVYLEQRGFRVIWVDGYAVIVSGQYDQIIDGELQDTKSTSVYTWINRSNVEKYSLQGSIYRWIRPDLITSDVMRIQHVFTDWQATQARINPDYPQSRLIEHQVELMPVAETEAWITRKIREIAIHQHRDEADILPCSEDDLWMSAPKFKYYSDPVKAQAGGRATKNFPNYPAAAAHANRQGKGVVVTVPGKAKACAYCAAAPACNQKTLYGYPAIGASLGPTTSQDEDETLSDDTIDMEP